MIKQILTYPHDMLREKAAEVGEALDDDTLGNIVYDLLDTARHHNARGLAATQIGIPLRIIVLKRGYQRKGTYDYYINPTILFESNRLHAEQEGCLSIPGVRVRINRAHLLDIQCTTLNGQTITQRLKGPCARAAQHEIDHLNGKLIIDYTTTGTIA